MEMNLDLVKKNVYRKVAKVVKLYVTPSPFGWPPTSSGNFYQMKRPMALRNEGDPKNDADK